MEPTEDVIEVQNEYLSLAKNMLEKKTKKKYKIFKYLIDV